MPVSLSNTNRTPSGGHLTKSRTSRATLANVLGGKFSELLLPILLPPEMEVAADDEDDEELAATTPAAATAVEVEVLPDNDDNNDGLSDIPGSSEDVRDVELLPPKRDAEAEAEAGGVVDIIDDDAAAATEEDDAAAAAASDDCPSTDIGDC